MSIKNQTVCITGAGSGIGRAISIEMNKVGYNVACADKNFESAQETVSLLNSQFSKSISLKVDVRNID